MPRGRPAACSAFPDGTHILGVSPKFLPTEAFQVAAETGTYLDVADAPRGCRAHDSTPGWASRGWVPGWHRSAHAVRPGELAADHPVPLVLGGEPLPAQLGVLCSSCNARKGLGQRRR